MSIDGRSEIQLLLDVLGVVCFQRVAVDSSGALEFTSEPDGSGQFDDGGFVFDGFGCFDSGFHGVNVMITVLDMLSMPSVTAHILPIGFETFHDILGEGA
jgi:hypothetical protein